MICQVFYAYTYGSAGWLGTQALPLILTPSLVISMLATEVHAPTGKSKQEILSNPPSTYPSRVLYIAPSPACP